VNSKSNFSNRTSRRVSNKTTSI